MDAGYEFDFLVVTHLETPVELKWENKQKCPIHFVEKAGRCTIIQDGRFTRNTAAKFQLPEVGNKSTYFCQTIIFIIN